MPPATKGKAHKRVERFSCRQFCRDGHDEAERARRGCARIDLEPVRWDVDAKKLRSGGWMGRAPLPPTVRRLAGIEINPEQPFEDPTEGCPASWSRSRFVHSVMPFVRRRAEGGARVPNPFFDRCDDELVLELVLYLEEQQEAFEAWAWEQTTNA